jgi:tetratricopeptide (TPR) repeat protein
VHWKIGNLNDSRHWLTRYRDSVIELYSLDPSNDIWPHEVVSGHHNLAVLDQESGNLMAAAEGFRSEIQLLDELLERAPTAQLLRNRADALSWMGNISLAQGDMVRSRKYYHQSSIVYETLLEHDEQNATSLYDLAYAMQLLAETAAMMGDLEGAVRYCQQAQTFFDTLVDRDATNLNWRRASSKPNIVRGHILAAQGQWQDAAAIARSTITDLEDILEAGAADHNVRDSLAKAYRLDAWVQQSTGEIKPALVSIDQAVMNLGEIDKADRLNDERTGMLATLHIMRGEIHLATGDTTHTKIAWQAANSLLEDKVNTSKSPYLLDPWARLLILTGDQSKGRAISSAMVKRRYKPLVNWPSSSGS